MGVIFQNGFFTQPTTVFWDNNYKSMGITTYPEILNVPGGGAPIDFTIYRSSITDNAPGVYSALGKTPILAGEKRMITYRIDFDAETSNPNYALGFGTRSTDLNDYIGSTDGQSVAITNQGEYWTNDNTYETGLPTFGNVGDIIDVAIEGEVQMWYRVNGGDWNGNVLANPATSTSGLEINQYTYYPAISLWGFNGPSVFSVYETSPYGLPSGFTQIPGDVTGISFTVTSDMFNSGVGYGSVCGNTQGEWNGLSGFTVSQVNQLWCGVYAVLSEYTQVESAFTSQGATMDYRGYIFDVVWGSGSTITNGVAKLAYNSNDHYIRISTVDPTDVDYLINDGDSSDSTSLVGTFNFPATFTFRTPTIDKGGWC